MLLSRCLTRRPLGLSRPSTFRVANANCNGIGVQVLNRGAGGVPGKRRKYRGDFKASEAVTQAANLFSLSTACAIRDYLRRGRTIALLSEWTDTLHWMAKEIGDR